MGTGRDRKSTRRKSAPRVRMTYEELNDPERLPFVRGVLSDLSGNNPGVEKGKIEERTFLEFDRGNFDSRMAAIQPGVTLCVANKLDNATDEKISINLGFRKMADFSPAAVARQVPATARLLHTREQLANLLRRMDGNAAAEDQLKKLLSDPQLMALLREHAAVDPAGSDTEK
jgi:type VI secretion system protein ImpB